MIIYEKPKVFLLLVEIVKALWKICSFGFVAKRQAMELVFSFKTSSFTSMNIV